VRSLADLGEDGKEALPELLLALDSLDPNMRSQAAIAIVQIAPKDTQLIRRVVDKVAKDKAQLVLINFSKSAREIAKLTSDAEDLLFAAINQSPEVYTRSEFIIALGELEHPKTSTVEFLEATLKGTDDNMRVAAAIALSHWQPNNPEVINVLADGFSGPDLAIKILTGKRLMELRVIAPKVEKVMADLLLQNSVTNGQPRTPIWLRGYAVNYFYQTGLRTNDVPSYFSNMLSNTIYSGELRSVLNMFSKIAQVHPKDRQEVQRVTGYLTSPAVEVRLGAIGAYRRFCEDDPSLSLAPLETLLTADRGMERFKAAEAIAKLNPQNPKLQEAISKWLVQAGYATKIEALKIIQSRPMLINRNKAQIAVLAKDSSVRIKKSAEKALASEADK